GATHIDVVAAATGTNVTYQWYRGAGILLDDSDPTEYSGTSTATLRIESPTAADADTYYVVVSNSCATATSSTMTLSVDQPIVITSLTGAGTYCEGTTPMQLEVQATGTGINQYTWYFQGTTQVGTNSPILVLDNITPAQEGTYTVVINNNCNQPVTSGPIVVVVDDKPVITTPPVAQNKCSGESIPLTVVATG